MMRAVISEGVEGVLEADGDDMDGEGIGFASVTTAATSFLFPPPPRC